MIRAEKSAAVADALLAASSELVRALAQLRFASPVAYVYQPLEYAIAGYRAYVERWGASRREILWIGMNPGPFGMMQTGVPFGDVAMVRDFLGIEARIEKPTRAHAKRPIDGFACKRSEVSGTRLWGTIRDRFGSPDAFFARFFVANYCPLAFVEESGANRTPDKLPAAERVPLFAACDEALAEVVVALAPSVVIGVGDFAKKRAELVVKRVGREVPVASILHPSPASPRANRGWAAEAQKTLLDLGLAWARGPSADEPVIRT